MRFLCWKCGKKGAAEDAYDILENPYKQLEGFISNLVFEEHYYYLGLSSSILDALVLERQALKHKVLAELREGRLVEELRTDRYRPEFYLFCADVLYANGLPVEAALAANLRRCARALRHRHYDRLVECVERLVRADPKPDADARLGVQFVTAD